MEDEYNIFEVQVKAFNRDDVARRVEIGTSELSYCSRKIYLRRVHNIPTGIQNTYMLQGTMWHELLPRWIPLLFPNAKKIEYEIEGKLENVQCHADVVVHEEEDFNVEYKTTKDQWVRMKPAYIDQANLTAYILNLTSFLVIVQNTTDLGNVNVQKFRLDAKRASRMIHRARDITKAIQKQLLPDGPEMEWECRYCELSHLCHDERRRDKNE